MTSWDDELADIGGAPAIRRRPAAADAEGGRPSVSEDVNAKRVAGLRRGTETIKKRPAAKALAHAVPTEFANNITTSVTRDTFGYFPLSSFVKRLLHTQPTSDGNGDGGNETAESGKVKRVWDWLMGRHHLMASFTVAARATRCSFAEVKRYAKRLASLVLHHDIAAREQLEWHYKEVTDRKRLVYSDNCAEDETPMALSLLHNFEVPPEYIKAFTPSSETAVVPMQSAEVPKTSASKARSKSTAKLVQSEQG